MSDGEKSGAAVVNEPQSGRWHVVWIFPLIWLVCWFAKKELLAFVGAPSVHELGIQTLSEPAEAFIAYLQLSTSLALIAVLPLLARLAFRRRRTPVGLVRISYAAVLLSALTVHYWLAPLLLRLLLIPLASSAPAAAVSLERLTGYLMTLYLMQTAAAQVAVVSGMRPPPAHSRSLGWAIVRWLLIGLGTFTVAVMMTPPDPISHWVLWLTWVAFWGIAKLASRFIGGVDARRDAEPLSAPVSDSALVSDSTHPNPYKPPAGG